MTQWSTLAVLAAVAVGAFAKGITGLGLPTVAVPVMAAFLGVEHAVVVMTIPGVVSNGWLLWRYRGEARGVRELPHLLVTGILGVAIGTWLLVRVDDRVLSLCLAAVIVAYVVVFLTKPGFALPARLTRLLSPVVGLASGALQGATGICGPLLATYLHGFRLRPRAYVFAVTALFLVFAVTQVLAVAQVGLFTARRLGEGLLALVPMAVALPAGMAFSRRLNHRTFDLIVLALLAFMGVKLLYDGFAP
ncbi:MAG: sulfite exporter TauE/SafE family protein [Streptomycetales bacterium]